MHAECRTGEVATRTDRRCLSDNDRGVVEDDTRRDGGRVVGIDTGCGDGLIAEPACERPPILGGDEARNPVGGQTAAATRTGRFGNRSYRWIAKRFESDVGLDGSNERFCVIRETTTDPPG